MAVIRVSIMAIGNMVGVGSVTYLNPQTDSTVQAGKKGDTTMKQYRFLAIFAVLIVALALPAAALAHPSSEGDGYCRFPDGTLTAGHCSAADHARGGHDTHIPSGPGNPAGGTPPPPPSTNNPPSGTPPPPPGGSGGGGASGTTPVYTGIDCHISHAARPAQICSVEGGLQY